MAGAGWKYFSCRGWTSFPLISRSRMSPRAAASRSSTGEFSDRGRARRTSDEDAELEELMDIVDPQNWADSGLAVVLPRDVVRGQNPAGMESGAVERLSTECTEDPAQRPLSETGNARRGEHGIHINDDLDEDRRGDSGLVEVDSGYIWITKAVDGGVQIKTSKALEICGLSPTGTAASACFSGWAQVGIDMLVDAAWRPAPTEPSTSHPPASPSPEPPGQQALPRLRNLADAPVAEAAPPRSCSPGFRRDLVEDTAEQMNHYIHATTPLTKNFARRWQYGFDKGGPATTVCLIVSARTMTDLAVGTFHLVLGATSA